MRNMQLTLSQASELSGRHKSTIQRAIVSGRLSAELIDGSYRIDETALFTAFPRHDTTLRNSSDATGNATECNTHATMESVEELTKLRAENALLREFVNDLRGSVDDLRGRLDSEIEERRRLTAITAKLLERDSVIDESTPNDRLLKKLFRGKGY
jgi:regulator of replication initiation timing